MTRQVAVVGHRSFIGSALLKKLEAIDDISPTIVSKTDLMSDMSGYDCVYLILGRAKPMIQHENDERTQLASFLMNRRPPQRMVYLSSMALTWSKQLCEAMISSHHDPRMQSYVLRPPAVFGPDQGLDTDMLIPSIIRSAGLLELHTPGQPTWFIHVDDLIEHMVSIGARGHFDPSAAAQPGSHAVIPGSFCVTPRNVLSLYETFRGLELQRSWRDQSSGW